MFRKTYRKRFTPRRPTYKKPVYRRPMTGAKLVNTVKKAIAKSGEKKLINYQTTAVIATYAQLTTAHPVMLGEGIAKGTGSNQRIGNKIQFTVLKGSISFEVGRTSVGMEPIRTRWMIVQDMMCNGAAPDYGKITERGTIISQLRTTLTSSTAQVDSGRYKILKDFTVIATPQSIAQTSKYQKKFKIFPKHPTTYFDGASSGNTTDCQGGGIFIIEYSEPNNNNTFTNVTWYVDHICYYKDS